jgi:hypothetical protein
MMTALSAGSAVEPREAFTPDGPVAESPRDSESIVISLTVDQAMSLQHSIPLLIADVRRQLAGRASSLTEVTVDLSAVPPIPACAPLLLLFRLLRRVVSRTTKLVVVGVNPALTACLVAGLPDDVLVVDQTGRRWPG